jgi:hypothetical protein
MRKATPIISTKDLLEDGGIMQIRVWALPIELPPSQHRYKYSLYYGQDGERLAAYDNERGKGDHKHMRGVEYPYVFVSIDRLVDDFMADVAAMQRGDL